MQVGTESQVVQCELFKGGKEVLSLRAPSPKIAIERGKRTARAISGKEKGCPIYGLKAVAVNPIRAVARLQATPE